MKLRFNAWWLLYALLFVMAGHLFFHLNYSRFIGGYDRMRRGGYYGDEGQYFNGAVPLSSIYFVYAAYFIIALIGIGVLQRRYSRPANSSQQIA